MKKSRLISLLFASTFSLASCDLFSNATSGIKDLIHTGLGKNDEDLVITNPSSKEDLKIINDTYYGIEYSRDVSKPTTGFADIEIYGVNDFHGAINAQYPEMGIKKVATFAKQKANTKNTLFIDTGDAFQGSLESNYNRGKLITECYNAANISAMTIGNHDFDWGVNALRDIHDLATFPMLGANIYNYDFTTKTNGDEHRDDFCYSYVTRVLDNGLKVGIIGTIGEDQITSICDNMVKDVCFKEQTKFIQDISDYLRTEKNCDLIISSSHSSFGQVNIDALTKVSSISNKRYIDLMLNGHSHVQAEYLNKDVLAIQTNSNGRDIEKITMRYDFQNEKVLDDYTESSFISSTEISSHITKVDSTINSIVDKYLNQTKDLGSQVLSSKISGRFTSNEEIPNLVAEAIYTKCHEQNIDVDIAVVNYAREDFPTKTLTYSDLYTSLPFDNEIHIFDIKGQDCKYSINKNFMYSDKNIKFDTSATYRLAVIDYLAYHVNSSRYYDYFPNMTYVQTLEKNHLPYTYREITKDYLLDNQSKTFRASDYSSYNSNFNLQSSY